MKEEENSENMRAEMAETSKGSKSGKNFLWERWRNPQGSKNRIKERKKEDSQSPKELNYKMN